MAEVQDHGDSGKKGGKKRPKKHSTHIDMTPMVDLMCLLITFFMLTTAFAKPKAMEIVLPEKKTDGKSPEIPESRTLNVLLTSNNTIYWYIGKFNPTDTKKTPPEFIKTDYSKDGIRKVLLSKNKELFKKIDELRENVKKGIVKPESIISKDSLNKLKKDKTENEILNFLITKEIKNLKSSDDVGPIVLIKADKENVKYKDFVRIIDEMAIASIARYAVVEPTPDELQKLGELTGKPVVIDKKETKK